MNAQRCCHINDGIRCEAAAKWELYTMKSYGTATYTCTAHVGELCDKEVPTTIYPLKTYRFNLGDRNLYFGGHNIGNAISTFIAAKPGEIENVIEIVEAN